MFKVTYDITDYYGNKYAGEFVAYTEVPEMLSLKIAAKHPEICLPFKSNNVKVKKA